MVTFVAIDVAVDGMAHSPFEPVTAKRTVSPGPMGEVLEPTAESARVSANRHGTIDTNEEEGVFPASTTCAMLNVVTAAADTSAATPTCTNLYRGIEPSIARRTDAGT
jgi:hypothetical protein